MSSMKDHLESTKASQEKLRSMQQKRDRGLTFGSDYKHPCKKEKEASLLCTELSHNDPTIDCKPYFDNYKSCNKFWTAVQVYRSMNMRKTRYDLPEGEEYEQWKKQLPQWLETQKLEIPDIVKDQQNKINTEE